MKIAYVANARIPTEKAHGLQIMEMCQAFAHLGHEVTLVVPKRKNPITQSSWEYYGIAPSFKIVYVPVFDFFVYVRWLGNVALWLISAVFGRRARSVIAALAPDIIYTRDPFAALWLPLGPKRVFEAHDFPKSRPGWYRGIWKRYDRIVTVTAGLKATFVDEGVPAERIVVAHDAADLQKFQTPNSKIQARELLGLPQEAFIAVYIGQLYPGKGGPDMLEAAKLAPEVTFVIGGGTATGSPNVRFVGRVPRPQVVQYLRAADVGLLPNRGGSAYDERYTSPMKLFEYLAAGRAIVASDLPFAHEVLGTDSASFVPPGNPQALAARLRELKGRPEEISRLEKASRSLAERYTWKARAEAVLAGISRK